MGYRRVLVGTDGSDTASVAVRHAAGLAVATGAELVLVTAYAHDALHGRELAEQREQAPEDLRWMITDAGEADERLTSARHLAAEAGVSKVRAMAARGEPAEVLISLAEELSCDVIVVGNVGMAGTGRFLLGSVPNKVSHHAPCDVLIVSTTG